MRYDLRGQKFGKWTVIREDTPRYKQRRWVCRCSCGTERSVYQAELLRGASTNCGCLRKGNLIHGGCGTRLYRIYYDMKSRCDNQSVPCYHRYGGKGVSICPEWQESFSSFRDWAVLNGYKDCLTIERKDVNGDYCPENCCWITMKEQAKNKENSIIVKMNGEEISLKQLSSITGVSYSTLYWRYKHNRDLLGGN